MLPTCGMNWNTVKHLNIGNPKRPFGRVFHAAAFYVIIVFIYLWSLSATADASYLARAVLPRDDSVSGSDDQDSSDFEQACNTQ